MNPSTALRSLSRASQNALRIQAGGLGLGRASQRTIWPAPSSILQKRAVPAAKQPAGLSIRFHSTDASSQPAKPLTDRETTPEQDTKSAKDAIAARKAEEPAYEMTFTCKKCLERSSHRITKQAYHFGTVLVTCPGCKNRHLISDHMKIFSDKGITIEDIMKEKGQFIRKGSLGADGDVEFYDEVATAESQGKPT